MSEIDIQELASRKEEVSAKVLEVGQQKAAEYFGTKRSTFRDFLYREKLPTQKAKLDKNNPSGIKVKPEEVEVTSKAAQSFDDPEQIVRDRGLNPDDWDFVGLIDNEWDSPTGEALKQRKLTLKSKKPTQLITPARTDGPTFSPPKPIKKKKGESSLVFVGGDDQAPFNDKYLAEKKCEFLSQINPDRIVKIGDTMDFPDISKYKKNPEIDEIARVNDCINAGYEVMRDERAAAPNAEIIKLIGNHDVRLRDFIIAYTPQLHGLKRAQIEGQEEDSVFSPNFLLRLDELHVDLVGEHANYEHGEVKLSKYLAARHGWVATKGSGTSALKTLEHLLYSVLVGHTHRLSLVHKTTHNIDGDLTTLAACETGCLCVVDKNGLGFTPSPDWQQGAATVEIWPDGKFHIDLINYVDRNLYWRGNRY